MVAMGWGGGWFHFKGAVGGNFSDEDTVLYPNGDGTYTDTHIVRTQRTAHQKNKVYCV